MCLKKSVNTGHKNTIHGCLLFKTVHWYYNTVHRERDPSSVASHGVSTISPCLRFNREVFPHLNQV